MDSNMNGSLNSSLENTTIINDKLANLIYGGFISLQLIGIALCIINAHFLKKKVEDVTKAKGKKCVAIRKYFPIRGELAGNILFVYHVFIFLGCVALGIAYDTQNILNNYERDKNIMKLFWLSALVNYAVMIYLVLNLAGNPMGNIVHAGLIFESLHLLTFWGTIVLMSVCSGMDCSDFQDTLAEFSRGYAALPMVISYFVLFAGGSRYYDAVKGIKIISVQEAVNAIKEKLHGSPAVECTVVCRKRHPPTNEEEYGKFHINLCTNKNNGVYN